jgi:hypothetical protein
LICESACSVTHSLAFGFALQANGAFGNIMGLDASNFFVAGTMQQNSSVFTLSSLAGDSAGTPARSGKIPKGRTDDWCQWLLRTGGDQEQKRFGGGDN